MEKDALSSLRIEKKEIFTGKKRTKKLLPISLVIVASLIIIGFVFYSKPYKVETSLVSYMYPFQRYSFLSASGYVVAEKKASVGVKTTGTLEWLGVEEGKVVKKGELIGRLENRDFLAALEQARANLGVQEAYLKQAEAELYDARLNFERNKELLKNGFISKAEFDVSEARLKKAEALLESQKAAVRAAEAMVRAAEISLDYTFIKAPFDGVVLTKDADVGDIVTPLGAATNAKASIVTIADLNSLEIEVDVSEQNIEKVKEGQACVIELDAFPDKKLRGRVKKIIPTADRTKASVKVKVSFVERPEGILPDMSAKVIFVNANLGQLDLVPVIGIKESSILRKADRTFVYVVNNGRIEQRDIILGERIGEFNVEVRQGLHAGERIVLNPTERLRHGLRVQIRE